MLVSASGAQAASKHRGAVLVKDIRPGHSGAILGPNGGGDVTPQLTDAGGTLYFGANDGRHGEELWRSNGTREGTRIVRNIRRGRAPSVPMYLTPVGRTLFFTAKDGRHGRELWRAGG